MYNDYYLPICGIMSEIEIITHTPAIRGRIGLFVLSLIILLTIVVGGLHSGAAIASHLGFIVAVMFFLIILLVIIAATIRKSMKRQRLVEIVKSHIVSASEDLIVFDKSMKITLGYLALRGVWRSSGKHRHYKVSSRFYEISNIFSNRIVLDRKFLDNYTIAVESDGEGYVKLPALLVKDTDVDRNGVVLVIVPSRTLYEDRDVSLKISTLYGDSAYASLKINNNVLEGTLLYLSKGKSRSVKIVIQGIIEHEVFGGIGIKKEVFKVKETGSHRFNIKLTIPKPLLIITPIKLFTPLYLARILYNVIGMSKTYLYGFSDGEYTLRLQLDIPLRPDKYVEEKIVFKPIIEKLA
jgi:hypothetical protein